MSMKKVAFEIVLPEFFISAEYWKKGY